MKAIAGSMSSTLEGTLEPPSRCQWDCCMQAKEWSANDEVKVHKSKLEREKEAAAAARQGPSQLSYQAMVISLRS